MGEHSVQQLLPQHDYQLVYTPKITALFLYSVKWVLRIVMWLLFLTWVASIFLYSLDTVLAFVKKLTHDNIETFLGIAGPVFLIYSGPVLVIAFLSVPYLIISGKEQLQGKKTPSYRLSTFPLLVNGQFGVISAAEFIGSALFVIYIIWAVCVHVMRNLATMNAAEFSSLYEKCSFMLKASGISMALMGIFCLAFLFISIARGSILLRLIDIPFGRAVRYHASLGHLIILLFTLHGLFYIIVWSMDGSLLQEILKWQGTDENNLAGVIGLSAALLIWITSLPPVRRKYFELFFYTHQLYIVFVIFLALHAGVVYFSMVAGAIFLFMLDRFLRFFQSRKTVDIVSATCFPSTGIVKLVLPKPQNLQYNALSFVFVQIPEISGLQWHPFSVSSSCLDCDNQICILIKDVGGWTAKIKELISSVCNETGYQEEVLNLLPHSKTLTASVEGPYGHELPHHLSYEKLILVAGGVGISPFLAVLTDIFHRIGQGKPCLVKNILLVWAVKSSKELSLLSTIDKKLLSPNLCNKVNLDLLIYITQESEPPMEVVRVEAMNSFACPLSNGSRMSVLAGTLNNMWFGIYLILTTLGFISVVCLLNIFYINPYRIRLGWYQGLLFLVSMASSVIIFGGPLVCLWYHWGRVFTHGHGDERSDHTRQAYNDDALAQEDSCQDVLSGLTKIRYGSRPNFKEIFRSISELWDHVDVGVIVCGPPTLEWSVAKECRSLNFNLKKQSNHPIFHLHSHSFSL